MPDAELLPEIIIRTADGREWMSVLEPAELAALVAAAERIRAAGLDDHNPAHVAAVAIARAVRAGTL